MRGDSIRDLYAKTLAVVGLAMLALAGAAVDYWPVGGSVPVLQVRLVSPQRDPVLARDLSGELVALNAALTMPVARAPRRATIALARSMPHAFRPATDLAAAIPVSMSPETVASLPDDDFMRVDDAMAVVTSSMVSVDLVPVFEPTPAVISGASDDSHGILADALKRTKDSLKDARLFLGDKFQGVVGALRRASPFFSTSPVAPF